MSLVPGTRLGPYELVSPLGAGGMGEVYRARDTRLRRDVAVKVLPADVATDPGRRARFEQKANATAALNHPNILGIHDIGHDRGVLYVATEIVAGETLASLIERGPISMRTLLDVAVQTADGVASAHAAGIVHRDLTPANIMVTTDGWVKILDFGLAKADRSRADWRWRNDACGPYGARDGYGHRQLHESRAGTRNGGGLSFRPVLVRSCPLRNGDGTEGVCEGGIGADDGGDCFGGAAAH